ncbi:hypothetical protein M9Y10_009653 [Tritrichomonas musculus]|uniref:Ubiquitinyl hydrolase 1 n=1 Tax=Tritrichomonas musculus TaxID=1915356 RepID=A0ABR2IQF9_9EUKA
MFGDISVNFVINSTKYRIELPCNATPKDFFERFLQTTLLDPQLFNFIMEKRNIANSISIVQTSSNPLLDYNFMVEQKKGSKPDQFVLSLSSTSGESKKIRFIYDSSKGNIISNINKIVSTYFKLNPGENHLKKHSDHFELIDKLYTLRAKVNGKDYVIYYSKNACVLDLKYYASAASQSSCSLFFIDNIQYRNSLLFSSIADLPGDKIFKKFQHEIFFKETGKEVKKAILEGSAIGRNVKRAIAKAVGQDPKGMLEDYLSIDCNGIHVPIDTFSKFNISLNSQTSPFIYGTPYEITLNIIMDDEPLDPIVKFFDPEITFEQIRKSISKFYQIDSPDFVKITDQSGATPPDFSKVDDFLSDSSEITCSISPPREVEALFILYSNKLVKSLTVDVDETNLSVLNRIAEKFQVNPKSVFLWSNDTQLIDTDHFVKNFLSSTNYVLAGKLKVEVTYQNSISTFSLPLSVEFESLASFCATKYGQPINSIGFYVQKDESFVAAYEPWNGPIFPGPQFIARYRNSEEKDFVKLIMKLQSDKHIDVSKVQINVAIFENGDFVNDTCEVLSSDKISKILGPKTLKKHSKGLDSNSLIYINDKLCRHSLLISEAFSSGKDSTIYIFPPGTFKYILPNEDKPKYIVISPSSTINDLINNISKSSKKLSLSYNGQLITDVSQPVQLFDPQIPFIGEFEKDTYYRLVYKKLKKDAKGKDETIIEKLPVNSKTTFGNVLNSACDLVKKKEGDKNIKLTQIRVSINSTLITKESERSILFDTFGPSADVDILKLEKISFTIQDQNFVLAHFSPEDTIKYAKATMLRKWEAKEKDIPYYFALVNNIAADDDELIMDYTDDDDLCFNIVPIQDTTKITLITPDFKHNFVIFKETIMYDFKERIAGFYDVDDVDSIELIDKSTNKVIDDNDDPYGDQIIQVKFKAGKPKLNEKYIKRFKSAATSAPSAKPAKKVDDVSSSSTIPSSKSLFNCPFRIQDETSGFFLELENDITCINAKRHIIEYMNASSRNKDGYTPDPENLLISIRNEKISNSELLMPKYLTEYQKNHDVSFIIETNKIVNFY